MTIPLALQPRAIDAAGNNATATVQIRANWGNHRRHKKGDTKGPKKKRKKPRKKTCYASTPVTQVARLFLWLFAGLFCASLWLYLRTAACALRFKRCHREKVNASMGLRRT